MVQISRQNIEMRLTCERPWVKVFTFTNVETIRFLWAVREWACNWIGRKNFLTTKRRSRSRVVPANARLFGALGASPLTTRAGIAYRLLRYLAVNGKKPRERDREREREREGRRRLCSSVRAASANGQDFPFWLRPFPTDRTQRGVLCT